MNNVVIKINTWYFFVHSEKFKFNKFVKILHQLILLFFIDLKIRNNNNNTLYTCKILQKDGVRTYSISQRIHDKFFFFEKYFLPLGNFFSHVIGLGIRNWEWTFFLPWFFSLLFYFSQIILWKCTSITIKIQINNGTLPN